MVFWILDDLGAAGLEMPTEDGSLVFDVRDINDGENNSPEHPFEKLLRKFEDLISIYGINGKFGFRTVVRCTLGVSRSNAFAAGLIAYLKDIEFEDALNIVKSKVPIAMPNMEIIDDVKKALAISRQQVAQTSHA